MQTNTKDNPEWKFDLPEHMTDERLRYWAKGCEPSNIQQLAAECLRLQEIASNSVKQLVATDAYIEYTKNELCDCNYVDGRRCTRCELLCRAQGKNID